MIKNRIVMLQILDKAITQKLTRKRFSEKTIVAFTNNTVFILFMFWPRVPSKNHT